jgi:hypothetical protein
VLGLPRHHRWQANRNHQLQELDLDPGHHDAEHFLLVWRAVHRFFDFHQALQDLVQLDFFQAEGHTLHYSVQVYSQCLHQEQVVFRVDQHPMHQDPDLVQAHQRYDLPAACQRDLFLPELKVDIDHLD